jgi:hypothetical protein
MEATVYAEISLPSINVLDVITPKGVCAEKILTARIHSRKMFCRPLSTPLLGMVLYIGQTGCCVCVGLLLQFVSLQVRAFEFHLSYKTSV